VRRLLRWTEAKGLTFHEINEAHVREYFDGLTASALRQTLPILRGIFGYLAKNKVVLESPIPSLKPSAFLPTVQDLKDILLETDPPLIEGSQEFGAELVLLFGFFRGNQDLDALSHLTQVRRDRVELYAKNLREAGVWTDDGYTCCRWHAQDGWGDTEFVLHALIARGVVKKQGDNEYILVDHLLRPEAAP
jgi:hypothetical protein